MFTRDRLLSKFVLAVAAFAIGSSSLLAAEKVSSELRKTAANERVQVIVSYSGSDAPVVGTKVGNITNGVVLQTTAAQAIRLSANPAVSYVAKDHKLVGTDNNRVALPNYDYLPQALQPQHGGDGTQSPTPEQGRYVGVALIDSGITTNADLAGRVVYSQSFVPGDLNNTTDKYGHGTHLAGIIAGNGSNSSGLGYSTNIHGVAPSVQIINLRVLDATGASTDSVVIQAIDKAIALKRTYNIQVINLSLGRPVYDSYTVDLLCQAVERAWNAGITVVVAAGNGGRNLPTQGYGTITAPGNDPRVITVGAFNTNGTATRSDDLIASYSSKGPTRLDHVVKPDVVAPGNRVVAVAAPGSSLEPATSTGFVNSSTGGQPRTYLEQEYRQVRHERQKHGCRDAGSALALPG